jgi:hypothetical protein
MAGLFFGVFQKWQRASEQSVLITKFTRSKPLFPRVDLLLEAPWMMWAAAGVAKGCPLRPLSIILPGAENGSNGYSPT